MNQPSLFKDPTRGQAEPKESAHPFPAEERAQKVKEKRLSNQCQRILERLQKGPATNVELAAISLKYTSRISDLRKLGHVIECKRLGGGLTRYTLRLTP